MEHRCSFALFVALLFVVVAQVVAAQTASDTVYPGQLTLAAPFFGIDTVDSYKQMGDSSIQTNTWIRDIEPGMEGDRRVLRVTTTHISLPDSDITRNLLLVDARDFSLIRQDVRAASDSGSVVCDSANYLTGWNQLPNRDMMIIDRPFDRRVFPDDGIGPWLLGLFPLHLHDTIVVPQFNLWTDSEHFATVVVDADGELINGKVKVPCWIIEIRGAGGPPGFKIRRWISKTSRRMLRQTATRSTNDPTFSAVTRHWF